MVSKAIVISYDAPQSVDMFDANGYFMVSVNALFVDTAIPGSGMLRQAIAHLNPATPATWTATIKQALVDLGLVFGFADLVTTSVYIPTYG